MKKIFSLRALLLVSAFLIIGCLSLSAQSNHTVTFSGNSSDFNSAEKYSAQGSGQNVDYYITFDASNLYIGAFRTNSSTFGYNDNFAVYIDTDPNSTPTSGTGTTSGQSYNSVTGTLPFTANYDFHLEQGYQEGRSSGSGWASTISGWGNYVTGTARELSIPLSVIGSPTSVYITMWMGYSGGTYANAPGSNLGGSNPTITDYVGGIGLTSAGCIPFASIDQPITSQLVNGSPTSGAVYGYVSETSGSYTAGGNFSIANGGSINVAGGTLALGSNTVTMGQSGLTTGNATTLNYASGTLTTTGSTLNFPSAGYLTGASAASLNNLTINNGALTLTTVPTINGTLTINGGNVSAAPVYGSSSTLTYNATYTRFVEWSATTAGTIGTTAGYPNNVTAATGTLTLYNSGQTGGGALAGTMTISSGATLTMAGYSGTMSVGGNWSDGGTFTPGTSGTVSFAGGAAQTIAKTGGETFYDLKIANTSGGVSLSNPATVTNLLTLTSGILTTTATNTLSVSNTATTAVSGGSTASYVSGPLNWTLPALLAASGSVYTFPVGDAVHSGGAYLPFSLTSLTSGVTGPVLQVQAVNSGSGGSADGITLQSISSTEYWSTSVVSGLLTSGEVSLTRQAAIGSLNAIGDATSQAGTYSSTGGATVSSNTISSTIPSLLSSASYFVMGETPGPVISSVVSNTTGGNSGYTGDTITISGTNLQVVSAANITFGGTAAASLITNTSAQLVVTLGTGTSGTISVTNITAQTGTYAGFSYLGYITNANGDWNTGGTWLGGSVPPSSATTTVANTVTVNGSSQPNPTSVTIKSGASLTFGASGTLTASAVTNNGTLAWSGAGTLTISASGTLTNNTGATFTGGTGTVNMAGAGTINGTLAMTLNNLTINTGALTLSTIPTINGTLTINGGSVSASPVYTSSSTLLYNVSYSRYNEWTAIGIGTIGTTAGYPNNVHISSSSTLDLANGDAGDPRACAGGLTIDAGSTLSMNVTAMTQPLNVGGSVSLAGTLILSGSSGGDIHVAGNWAFTAGGTFTTNDRAVFFIGSTQQVISRSAAGTLNFDYIVDDNSGGGLQLSSGTNVNVNAGGGGSGLIMGGSGTGNTFDLNGNTANLSSTASIQLTGAQVITSSAGTGTVTVASGSTTDAVTTPSSGSITFNSSVTIQLNGGFNFGSGLSTVNGTLQINSGGYVNTNPPAYGTGSLLQYYSGTTPYVRGPEWSAGSGAGYPYNVQVSNTTTIDAGGTSYTGTALNLAGNLTIDASSSLYMDYSLHNMTVPLTVAGNLLMNGNLSESGASGGDVYVGGNWTHNSGTFGPNGRAVFFNGSSNSTMTASGGETFAYLIITKSGSATVTLANSATVSNVLTLTTGVVNMGTNTLILSSSASTALASGYGTSSYINGKLQRYVTSSTSYDFPVGTGSNYELANITFSAGLTGTSYLTGSYTSGATTQPDSNVCVVNASKIGSLLNGGFWTITADAEPTAGTYTATLNMNGFSNAPSANGSVTPAEQIGLVKRDNGTSSWLGCGVMVKGGSNQGYGSATDNGTLSGSSASVTRSGIPSFSDFGIGIEADNNYALPVQLVYFTAEKSGNNADLRWSTASEINNAYFDIQRSTDGQTFEDIGQVAGHGNSEVTINYSYTDQNISALGVPVVYYRLKQVDVDGHYQYSPMAAVNISGSSQSIHVTSMYPNPVTDHMTVSYTSSARQAVRISVCDVQGKIVGEETQTNAEGGMNVYEVPGVSSLAPGFYMLHVNTGTESYQFKVVKGE